MNARPTPLSDRLAGVLLGLLGVALCAVLAGYLVVRHVVWPRLDHWRPELLEQVERHLGRQVSVDAIRPSWEGLHPALEIDGLRIAGTDGAPRLEVGSAYARVSWRSLAWRVPRLALLRLDAPSVTVERLAPGRFAVAGFDVSTSGEADGRGLDWLLTQGELAIERATLRFVDRAGELSPLEIGDVALRLRSTGRRHQASLDVPRAGDAAEAATAVAEFYRAPLARPSDWRRWTGEAHLSGTAVSLARVAALAQALGAGLPGAAAEARGRIDALAWLRFDHAAVVDGTLKLRGDDLSASLPDGPLAFASLAAEARVERERDGGHRVRIAGLSATDAEGFSVAADGDAELGFAPDAELRAAWLRLQAFDVATALRAARRMPLPAPIRERLAPVSASGEVHDLTLRWRRTDATPAELRPADRSAESGLARPAAPRIELSANFDRLAVTPGRIAPDGRPLPGFANLTGSVRASERDGTVTLASRQATLVLAGLLDEPAIALDRLDGRADWRFDAASRAIEVDVPRLEFANADARGSASGGWRGGEGRGPGSIELAGRLDRADVRRIARYLPSRLPEKVRAWAGHALLAGTGEGVRIELRGDLRDFPFRDPSTGRFRIAGPVRDAVLAFHPQWPRIEQIRGEVAFENAGFEIRAPSATTAGARLSDVVARMADYRDAVLVVDGRAASAAQDMVDARRRRGRSARQRREPRRDAAGIQRGFRARRVHRARLRAARAARHAAGRPGPGRGASRGRRPDARRGDRLDRRRRHARARRQPADPPARRPHRLPRQRRRRAPRVHAAHRVRPGRPVQLAARALRQARRRRVAAAGRVAPHRPARRILAAARRPARASPARRHRVRGRARARSGHAADAGAAGRIRARRRARAA
jgi:uncharacterized protein YhdP